jgi:Cu-Zn family superoxide dismutase
MKNLKLIALAFSVVFATSCKDNKKETKEIEEVVETEVEEMVDEITPEKTITITLSPKSGSNAEGTLTFTEKDGMVTMEGKVTGLEEGSHGIHIHEKADCSSPDGKSTGGHWNPTGQPHGTWGDAAGYHKGDIGNIEIGENGEGTIAMTTDEWCIGCDDETKNIIGKAIIVHLDADDFTSQPSGNAGARVGCAGIIE